MQQRPRRLVPLTVWFWAAYLVKRTVAPGTLILTDGWPAYASLPEPGLPPSAPHPAHPVTQGGIGVREAALAAPFGAPPAMTVAVGLVWETIILVGGLVAGVISYSLRGRRGARSSS